MKAAEYTRVSISEQAEDGFSLESQDHNIHAFARSKGMEVVHDLPGCRHLRHPFRPPRARAAPGRRREGQVRRRHRPLDRPLLPRPAGAAQGTQSPAAARRRLYLDQREHRLYHPLGQAGPRRPRLPGRDLYRPPLRGHPARQATARPQRALERQPAPRLLPRQLRHLHRAQRTGLLPPRRASPTAHKTRGWCCIPSNPRPSDWPSNGMPPPNTRTARLPRCSTPTSTPCPMAPSLTSAPRAGPA